MLKRTVDFMKDKVEERRDLIRRIEAAGGTVPENLKRWVFSSHANANGC